ncbi:unnamed protein product [Effrenium voratum]|uniref:Uncharacterized protein n=1 Tax=Effrenium voratum TaxID=2562239 RepID=A0AA36JN88_9DINO|nr:unnamed protein product [Effrenium voratum]
MEQQPLVESKSVQSTGCCCGDSSKSNVSDEFIDKYLDGDVSYGYWKLPERPDYVTRATLGRLEDRGPWPTTLLFREQSDLTIGYANARDMMEIMYEASKVPGVFEKIPDPLKGVFWMKGNGVGEELLVLQYSQYYEKEKVMLTPLAPFMWAWPNGAPPDAPFGGFMYPGARGAGQLRTAELRGGASRSAP